MKETFGAAPSPRKRHDSGTFKIGEGPRTGLDRPKKPVIAEVDEFDFSIPEVVEEGSVGTEFDPLDQAGQEYDPIAQKIDAGIGRGLLEARAKRARAIPEITNPKRLLIFLDPQPIKPNREILLVVQNKLPKKRSRRLSVLFHIFLDPLLTRQSRGA